MKETVNYKWNRKELCNQLWGECKNGNNETLNTNQKLKEFKKRVLLTLEDLSNRDTIINIMNDLKPTGNEDVDNTESLYYCIRNLFNKESGKQAIGYVYNKLDLSKVIQCFPKAFVSYDYEIDGFRCELN